MHMVCRRSDVIMLTSRNPVYLEGYIALHIMILRSRVGSIASFLMDQATSSAS